MPRAAAAVDVTAPGLRLKVPDGTAPRLPGPDLPEVAAAVAVLSSAPVAVPVPAPVATAAVLAVVRVVAPTGAAGACEVSALPGLGLDGDVVGLGEGVVSGVGEPVFVSCTVS